MYDLKSLHGTLQIWICSQCIVLMYEQKGVDDPSCLSSSMQGHSKLWGQMMKQEKTDEEHRGAPTARHCQKAAECEEVLKLWVVQAN